MHPLRLALLTSLAPALLHAAGAYVAFSPSQQIEARFHDGSTDFLWRGQRVTLTLAGEGPVVRDSQANGEYRFEHTRLTEWFLNRPSGFEQGFTIAHPSALGRLRLTLETSGDLRPRLRGSEIVFIDSAGAVLRYGDISTQDADGRRLPTRLSVDGTAIRFEVDDSGARYPITIDPIVQTARLSPSDDVKGNEFGIATALSRDGSLALMGAGQADSTRGTVYAFIKSGSAFTQTQEITNPNAAAGDDFGQSIAMSADGSLALIGAPGASGGFGVTYVYAGSGGAWSMITFLTGPSNTAGRFGNSVSLSADGSTALILGGSSGYVFTHSGTVWTLQTTLSPPGATAGAASGLAAALSANGDVALFGESNSANGYGEAVLYNRTSGTWTLTHIFSEQAGEVIGAQFGVSVALNDAGTVALIGEYCPTSDVPTAYFYTLGSSGWAKQQQVSGDQSPNFFGYQVRLNSIGDRAVIGAYGFDGNSGAAYLYGAVNGVWDRQAAFSGQDTVPGDNFGRSIAFSGDGSTLLVGAPKRSLPIVYSYAIENVSVLSSPSGMTFTVAGTGCPAGTFQTPYSGLWQAECTVTWTTPVLQAGGRYTFQNWFDGSTSNPRTLPPTDVNSSVVFTANFLTEYQLTTAAAPAQGSINPPTGTWYTAGTSATVVAKPNPGFVFSGFTGALSGENPIQTLVMNQAQGVTANFVATPVSSQTGAITAKTGAANARQWTISVANSGPGVAYDTQLVGVMLTQTFGTTCATAPVRLSPVFPVSLGDIGPNGSAQTNVTFDFSGCPSTARFTVLMDSVSNGGAAVGLIQLSNQFQ